MRFTLTYKGELPSRGKAVPRHALRRALHPQLRQLWMHPPLSACGHWLDPGVSGDQAGAALFTRGGHQFAVIVRRDIRLVAELDVLLLRPEQPGSILQDADIDNRFKTVFDALCYPQQDQQVPGDWHPGPEEEPLFCLLEDDRLVTRVTLDTDRLLAAENPEHVALTIRVQLRAFSPTWASVLLLS